MEKLYIKTFGKYKIRYVDIEDAEFILDLRTDPELSKFLNATEYDINKQIEWIKNYKIKEANGQEHYFLMEVEDNKLGVYRIYDIKDDSVTYGSWLFKPSNEYKAPIVMDIFIKDFIFNNLRKNILFFDVRKGNNKVLRYHSFFNPQKIGEDELKFYFKIEKENYFKIREKFILQFSLDEYFL